MAREPRVLAIDAGGTMTDTFVVDRAGAFVVGKAQTTPQDESVGLMSSVISPTSSGPTMRNWHTLPPGPSMRAALVSLPFTPSAVDSAVWVQSFASPIVPP